MARDNAENLLDRRSYLKVAGGTVAGGGILLSSGTRSGAAQAEKIDIDDGDVIDPYLNDLSDGDVIEIPQGEYVFNGATISANNWEVIGNGSTFDVRGDVQFQPEGNGWTFGGVEFQVASGNVRCLPRGGNWTLRNLSWTGPNTQGSPLVRPYVDAGSTATIENCWFGHGMGTRVGESAIKGNSDGRGNYSINGELTVKGCYFRQNTCYASASAGSGQPGRVHFDSCYFQDSYLSAIRTGSINGACNVTNCVITLENASDVPETSSGVSNTRGIWAYWGEVVVEDTDIYTPGKSALLVDSSKGAAGITARNCEVVGNIGSGVSRSNIGSDPRRSPPEGCVTSPEEAYLGEVSARSVAETEQPSVEELWEDGSNHLVFNGGSTDRTAEYRIQGRGNAEYGEDSNTNDGDQYRDTIRTDGDEFVIEGYLGGSSDDYRVTGAITSVDVDGGVSTTLNGIRIEAGELEGVGSWEESLDNVILVDGVGTGETTRYEFTVSGAAEHSTYQGASIDGKDTIDSGTVTGAVAGWRDAFRFSGELEAVTVDGPARVSVNGDRIDPSEYGSSQPHVLTIVGNGSDATYEVTVDGTISLSDDDAERNAELVSERIVEGSIERGAQKFRFSGELADVTFTSGSAHVYLDGDRINPAAYGEQTLLPNAIVIDGTDTDGETSYSFTVDGDVVTSSYRDASLESGDEIDGRSVSGRVDNSLDAYWFDGDIVDFKLVGDAGVDVEYDVRDR